MKKKIFVLITCVCVLFTFVACGGPTPDEQYSSIQKQINKAEDLETSYFAKFIDSKDLDSAKEAAQKALDNSDEESYEAVLNDLKTQVSDFKEALKKESAKYYNKATTKDLTDKYPFAVDTDAIMSDFNFLPVEKQTSAFPTWFVMSEAETTDTEPSLQVNQGGYSFNPLYEFNKVETKEVTVKVGDKKKKALVNTEMKLSTGTQTGMLPGDNTGKVVGPSYYFVKDKNGVITLLVHDMEGGEFYVPYQ